MGTYKGSIQCNKMPGMVVHICGPSTARLRQEDCRFQLNLDSFAI